MCAHCQARVLIVYVCSVTEINYRSCNSYSRALFQICRYYNIKFIIIFSRRVSRSVKLKRNDEQKSFVRLFCYPFGFSIQDFYIFKSLFCQGYQRAELFYYPLIKLMQRVKLFVGFVFLVFFSKCLVIQRVTQTIQQVVHSLWHAFSGRLRK